MDNSTLNALVNRAAALSSDFQDMLLQATDLLVKSAIVDSTMNKCCKFRDDLLLKHLKKHSTDKVQLKLLQENSDLKETIEEYQVGIEKLLAKYKDHCDSDALYETYNLRQRYIQNLEEIVKNQNQRIEQMAAIMDMAADLEDRDNLSNQLTISQLTAENKMMRRQLQLNPSFEQPVRICQEGSTQIEEHELEPLLSSDDGSLNSSDSFITCMTSGCDNMSSSSSSAVSDLAVDRFIEEAINQQYDEPNDTI